MEWSNDGIDLERVQAIGRKHFEGGAEADRSRRPCWAATGRSCWAERDDGPDCLRQSDAVAHENDPVDALPDRRQKSGATLSACRSPMTAAGTRERYRPRFYK
jgi:hypothetical protein